MKLIRYPDPILLQPSGHCVQEDLEFINHSVPEMTKVMNDLKGVGLAAVQVGILKRFCIVKDANDNVNLIINPELESGIELKPLEEGCLSLPYFWEKVERFEQVTVRFIDKDWIERRAVFTGQEAQCIQHEIGHMNGELILQTVSPMKQQMWKKKAHKNGAL